MKTRHTPFASRKQISTTFNAKLKSRRIGSAVALALPFLPFGSASAQQPEIEEVIVTSERREQNIQDIAATVQAFDATRLQDLAINNDFKNLQNLVPGLQITNQEGKIEVFLRGIGSADSDFSSDPSVATHYNGVYLPRPRSIGPMFFDVQRVEVNKGPQGTLRGRNATGGTINIISNKPDFDGFSGYIQAGAGNYRARNSEAVVNLPLSNTLALRAAVFSYSHDPYYSNAYGDEVQAPGAEDAAGIRVSALWEPNDRFSAYVIADQVSEQGSGYPGAFSGRALSAGFDIDDLDDPYRQYFRTAGLAENDIAGIGATLTYHFDQFSLEYNGSLRSYEYYNANASREWQLGLVYPGSEAEATYSIFYDPAYRAAGNINAFPERLNWNDTFYQTEQSTTQVNELRAYGENGPLVWSAGAFLFSEEFDYLSQEINNGYFGDCDWYAADTVCGWQDGLGGEDRGDGSTVDSQAVYFDGTFSVKDNLRIKFGARYTKDEKTANESNVKYQFNFPEALLSDFGLTPDTRTNPYTTGLVIGSPGFRLRGPGDRQLNNPSVCPSVWSAADIAAANCVAGDNNIDYFVDGIQSFGNADNWDEFLSQYRDQVDVIIRSDFFFDPDPTTSGEANENRSVSLSNTLEDSYTDFRLGLEMDLADEHLVYAMFSTGTRAGGINRPLRLGDGQQLARAWEPEQLLVYELGSKNQWLLGNTPLTLNGALFYYDYSDKVLQSLVVVPNSRTNCGDNGNEQCTDSFVFSENATDATLMGLEIDGSLLLPAGFELTWNSVFLDSEMKNSAILDTRGGNRVVNVDGNVLPNTSRVNFNMALNQRRDVNWGSISAYNWTLSMAHRSHYFLTPYNNQGYAENEAGEQIRIPLEEMVPNNNGALSNAGGEANGRFFSDRVEGYVQLNFSAGLAFGEHFRLDAFVNNLTEEVYSGKGFINQDVNIRFLNNPRTYGLSLRAQF